MDRWQSTVLALVASELLQKSTYIKRLFFFCSAMKEVVEWRVSIIHRGNL